MGILLLWCHQRCAVISSLSAAATPCHATPHHATPHHADSWLFQPAHLTHKCVSVSRGPGWGESEMGDICLPWDLVCLGGTWGEKLKCIEVLMCPGCRGEPGWQFNVLWGDPLCCLTILVSLIASVSNCIPPSWRLTKGLWVLINTAQLHGILWELLSGVKEKAPRLLPPLWKLAWRLWSIPALGWSISTREAGWAGGEGGSEADKGLVKLLLCLLPVIPD